MASTRHSPAAYEGGRGTPVVLLHGLTGTWHIWKPVISLLEAHHRVIALTLPGHAGGPPLPAGVEPTIASMADGIESSLRDRGLDSAHFLGNSLGGWLSLEMARRGVARSVTALSPAGSWSTPEEYRAIARSFRVFYVMMPVVFAIVLPFVWSSAVRRALLTQTMERGDRLSPRELVASLLAFMRARVLLPLLRSMGRDGSIRPLEAPNVPLRIVWSGADRVIPFDPYGQTMRERVPGARHSVLPNVGHVPMYDDPQGIASTVLELTLAVDGEA